MCGATTDTSSQTSESTLMQCESLTVCAQITHLHAMALVRCCGRGERDTRQPIRATSRDRLSSKTSEEMEARLMSCATKV